MVYSHNDLTTLGVRWLKRGSHRNGRCQSGPGCTFVASEVKAAHAGEVVDALGFRTAEGMETVLVEAKASRADFLVDAKKPHRNGDKAGTGNYRYYLCPEGLIQPHELPDGWGLLWAGNRRSITVMAGHVLAGHFGKGEFWFQSDRDAELALMTWLMVKVGDNEKLIRERKRLVRDFNRVAQAADRCDHQRRNLSSENSRLREALYVAGLDPECV